MGEQSLFVGLISGTSVDGVDCALVQFDSDKPRLIATHSHNIPSALRESILELCSGETNGLVQLGTVHIELGKLFAEAVTELLNQSGHSASDIVAIGSHGQTVWHEPEAQHPFTLQLADPNTIAQLTGITTIADMRGRDMAAGGQGAPLAPLLHRQVFRSNEVNRAVINIGGFGNITSLPTSGSNLAFDTGPGNVLMDYWIEKNLQQTFDKEGSWAASGKCNTELLDVLLEEEYFHKQPPKSTGRELFNGKWLEAKLLSFGKEIAPEDVQATLLQLTATTITNDLARCTEVQEIYVCGGGAHNKSLMSALNELAKGATVQSTAELGIDPDWVEAIAFAWMAYQTVQGNTIETGEFTGANKPVILGGIYQA